MASQGDKTEKPTAKRLKDARERGQIARSRDLSLAIASLAATGMLASIGPMAIRRLATHMTTSIAALGRAPASTIQPEQLTGVVLTGGAMLAMLVGPVALAAAGAGIASALAQGGVNVATQALKPSLERLSPANGIKRFGFKQSGADTIKAILTSAVLGVLAWQAVRALMDESGEFPWMPAPATANHGWQRMTGLLWQAGFALAALGAADYGLQRWRIISSLKMTRQELKDEAKSSEGSPEVRGRVRRIQRDMARRRMLRAAANATVVITNPTHFAVALEYRREKNPAPVVVAKGQDVLAARIREIAREHSVPIMENPPLARALYKGAEVGETIPSELFGAVAEVLAYLIRIKQLML